MDFNLKNNGVFEPDGQASGKPAIKPAARRTGGFGLPDAFGLPVLSEDLIGICGLAIEVILLFVFRDAIFYNFIQPMLNMLINVSAIVIYIGGLILTAVCGFKSFIRKKRRDRGYF